MKSEKIYWLPAILSMILPGLGQLVKGNLARAIVMYLLVLGTWFVFGRFWLTWVIYAVIWLANVLDAALSDWKE